MSQSKAGAITWTDLTVPEAEELAGFYADVVGWTSDPTSMGDYDDYTMVRPHDGEGVAGVCHARGTNSGIPAQWLLYVTVDDLDTSLKRCDALGGDIVRVPASLAGGRFAIIQDPAGAVMALFEAPDDQ